MMFCGIIIFLFIHEIQTNAVQLASNYEQDYHYTGYKGVDEETCKSLFPQMGSKGVDEETCKSLFPQIGSKDKLTVKGIRCIFPFSYRGIKYNDCAPGVSIGQPSPWCAISTKDNYANTVKNWDVCVSDENRLTVKGTRCIFPFVYRGETFTSCAPGVSQPSPWCATLLQDNREPKDWDVCVPDTRIDDKVCKSLIKDNCKSKSIIELCPQMCSKEIDDEFCLLLDKNQCKKESINKRCPQFCSKEIDEGICLLLDKDQCRKKSISKRCPQFCSKEIDEEICLLLDKDQCRKVSIYKRCPQFCSKGVCIPKCINGKCTDDNLCACNDGWIGDTCEIAECDPKCINGICTDEHRCRCDEQWIGQACDIAECNPRCINGFCNDNSRCTCYDGYKGAACDGLTCPESEDFFKVDGSVQCYRAYVDKTRSWTDSDAQCKSEGLALAEPNNPIQIRKYLNGKYGDNYYWLGGVGTGSSVEFQRGGGHIYPGDALWMIEHPSRYGYTRAQCLTMTASDSNLWSHPLTPYRTYTCSYDGVYALCEVVVE